MTTSALDCVPRSNCMRFFCPEERLAQSISIYCWQKGGVYRDNKSKER